MLTDGWVRIAASAFLMASGGCQASQLESDLAALIRPAAPGLMIADCQIFDSDWLAPAGSCLAKGTAANFDAMLSGLKLQPYFWVSSSRASSINARGCR